MGLFYGKIIEGRPCISGHHESCGRNHMRCLARPSYIRSRSYQYALPSDGAQGGRKTPFKPPPNGEPETVRYTVAYGVFSWNCVAVRAANLQGRCQFLASGPPAASAGVSDGALNADSQIDRLLKKRVTSEVQKYLRSIASTPAAKWKMRPYFDEPTPEVVK